MLPVNSPAKYYEVEQTRTVKVWASTAAEAAYIATSEFAKAQDSETTLPNELQGRVIGNIEVTRLDISKEL